MKISTPIFRLLTLVLGVVVASCSHSEQIPTPSAGDHLQEVRVAAPLGSTRTELEENGTVTRWSPGDRIALWAHDGSALALTAQRFTLFHFSEEFPTAYFTAHVSQMTAENYTYYGCYPQPTSTNGTVATFDLPATQDGANNLQHALMVARPQQGASLTASEEELHLDFVHKLHVLKITIPESKNLMGAPIERLQIEFPVEVTGTLTTDVSSVDSEVTLTSGSKVLMLDLAEPIHAGDTVYAVIAPVDASSGVITFRGYTATEESQPISVVGKNFLPARTTPIRLTIPSMRYITRIYFKVGDNYLGEKPNQFTIAVNGGTFPDGSTTCTFDMVEGQDTYEYIYEGKFTDNFSGKSLTYTFDSDNALVTNTHSAVQLISYGRNTLSAVDVPYLLFEDFSGITSFDSHSSYKGSDPYNHDAVELGGYGLSGWYGARVGGGAGQNIRIASRAEVGLGAVARYNGRVDTPALSGIKSGKSVKILVEYDYAGDRYEGVGNKQASPVYSAGTSTSAVSKGGNTIESVASNVNGVVLAIDGPAQNGTYYGNTPHSTSFTMASCTNSTRVSWYVINNIGSALGANGMYWLYIDNVRVSITQ